MRTIYWAGGVCALLVAGLLVARQAAQEAPRQIPCDEVVKLLETPQSVTFVDVREPNEIAVTGTLKNALTIPVGQIEERIKDVPQGKPVVPFCRSGRRATRAAAVLESHGYKVVGVFGLEPYYEQLKKYIVNPN